MRLIYECFTSIIGVIEVVKLNSSLKCCFARQPDARVVKSSTIDYFYTFNDSQSILFNSIKFFIIVFAYRTIVVVSNDH